MIKAKAKRILFWHSILGCHFFWRSINPYHRECKICKRRDQEFGWSYHGKGWWETVADGKHGETNGVYVKTYW